MLRTRVGNQKRNNDVELCFQALNQSRSIFSERIYMKRMYAEMCLNMERDEVCSLTMSGNDVRDALFIDPFDEMIKLI